MNTRVICISYGIPLFLTLFLEHTCKSLYLIFWRQMKVSNHNQTNTIIHLTSFMNDHYTLVYKLFSKKKQAFNLLMDTSYIPCFTQQTSLEEASTTIFLFFFEQQVFWKATLIAFQILTFLS